MQTGIRSTRRWIIDSASTRMNQIITVNAKAAEIEIQTADFGSSISASGVAGAGTRHTNLSTLMISSITVLSERIATAGARATTDFVDECSKLNSWSRRRDLNVNGNNNDDDGMQSRKCM